MDKIFFNNFIDIFLESAKNFDNNSVINDNQRLQYDKNYLDFDTSIHESKKYLSKILTKLILSIINTIKREAVKEKQEQKI